MRIHMASLSLSRRCWTGDWLAMMGSIGRARDYAFRIDATQKANEPNAYAYTLYAWRSGRLYLFVNGAINHSKRDHLCGGVDTDVSWHCYYDNNLGTANITVKEVAER